METIDEKLDTAIARYFDAVSRLTESILGSALKIAKKDQIKIVDKDWWEKDILSLRTFLIDGEWFGEIVASMDGEKINVTGRHQSIPKRKLGDYDI